MAKLVDHTMAAMPLTRKRSRKKGDRRSKKDDKNRQAEHAQDYKKERRRPKIKECRDYKECERKRKGEGGCVGGKVPQDNRTAHIGVLRSYGYDH